ncbi:MAG: redoxin domain-containing protein [Planctomycetia bacterium]
MGTRMHGRGGWLPRVAVVGILLGLVAWTALRSRAVGAGEPPGTARVDSIKDIRLPALDGKELALSDYRTAPALVLCWTAPGCPVAEVLAPRIKSLAEAFSARGVVFLGVCSDAGTPLERLVAKQAEHGWSFPVLRDEAGVLAQRVGARTTTTVVLLDRNRRIRYRGALDDQYGVTGRKPAPTRAHLALALEEVLAHQPVSLADTTAPGCPISFAAPAAQPTARTWAGEAAAIVHRRCAGCHRPGEAGPFPLLAYEDVAGRTAVLREVIEQGRMPPWTAEGPQGMFADDRRLSPQERTVLLEWLGGGAPEGDPAAAPSAPEPVTQDGWEIGTPDLVLEFSQAQEVPAEGVVPYRFVEVPTHLDEDRWVVASEVRPGAPQVVHHVLVQVVPEAARARRSAFEPHLGFFAAMVPGGRATRYPEGMAKKLPKGSRLYFQMHYTPNGIAQQDRTRIGLRFAKEPPREEVRTIGVFPFGLDIPPGAPAHQASALVPVPFDAKVLAYMPHMHLRGKAVRYEVIDLRAPQAAPELLFEIKRYDFNWQTPYRLAEPRLVRGGAGIMLKVTGTFDNSYGNPYNPDPEQRVRWGDQTWDEMLIGYLDYVQAGPGTARQQPAPAAPAEGTDAPSGAPAR